MTPDIQALRDEAKRAESLWRWAVSATQSAADTLSACRRVEEETAARCDAARSALAKAEGAKRRTTR